MKILHSKVRYGKLVTDIVYSDLRAKRAIIFGYGLLSSPRRHDDPIIRKFVQNGFVVFLPRYYGTYESDGVCTFENAVDSLLDAIKLVKKRCARDIRSNDVAKWNAEQIILSGGSFGGAAALVAGAKSRSVRKIISIAGPTDWRTQRGTSAYRLMWSIAYKNTWRCSKAAWKNLINGKLDLNAVDYAKVLRDKDVMFIHGSDDKIVSLRHSKILFEKLQGGKGNHKLIVIKDVGHHGILGFLTRPRIFKQAMRWMKS